MYGLLWVLVACAIGIVLVASFRRTKVRSARMLIVAALVLVLSGLTISVVDKAGATTMARPVEHHNIQCIAGGLGVAGAWLGTLGSIPTTGGLVTGAAATAASGATLAWYDSCPEYVHKILGFINPSSDDFWLVRTVWEGLKSLISNNTSYHSTGRFCVARHNDSTKRCFYWRNLNRNQMHRAFHQWLVMYNIPARLYEGQLYVTR